MEHGVERRKESVLVILVYALYRAHGGKIKLDLRLSSTVVPGTKGVGGFACRSCVCRGKTAIGGNLKGGRCEVRTAMAPSSIFGLFNCILHMHTIAEVSNMNCSFSRARARAASPASGTGKMQAAIRNRK